MFSLYVIILNFIKVIWCTTDISLPELEYIANHLEPDECWKLTIILHSTSFELTNELDKNQQPVLADVNCLEQLLHWNSQPNEGFDETHAILAHRLRQINRRDLSNWLTKTVFEELGKDLNKSLSNDILFNYLISSTTDSSFVDFFGNYSDRLVLESTLWKPYDTVLSVVVVLLLITLIWLTCLTLIKTKISYESQSKNFINKDVEQGYPLLKEDTLF